MIKQEKMNKLDRILEQFGIQNLLYGQSLPFCHSVPAEAVFDGIHQGALVPGEDYSQKIIVLTEDTLPEDINWSQGVRLILMERVWVTQPEPCYVTKPCNRGYKRVKITPEPLPEAEPKVSSEVLKKVTSKAIEAYPAPSAVAVIYVYDLQTALKVIELTFNEPGPNKKPPLAGESVEDIYNRTAARKPAPTTTKDHHCPYCGKLLDWRYYPKTEEVVYERHCHRCRQGSAAAQRNMQYCLRPDPI